MTDDRRHESDDLGDYEVLDASDTLDGPPGDDPLDRGVVTPDRWSAGMRFTVQADESLDQLLAEEEPDVAVDADDDPNEDAGWDENTPEDDIGRDLRGQGPDPRAGRLVESGEEAYDSDQAYLVAHDDFVAHDAGIDGGGATAEEAAVHIVDDETDQRPGG